MCKNNTNEDEYNLSDMIDEYEGDSDLRKKIEAMKQQRDHNDHAVWEAMEEVSEEAMEETDADTRKLPVYEDSLRNSFLEDEAEKTQIMERGAFFNHSSNHEESDSVYLYDNREVDEEEITEDDIEEFLEDRDKAKLSKRTADANKMNKIITGTIIAVISICLVVGIGYGVKTLIGGEETPSAQKEPNKPNTTDKDPKPNTNKDPDDKDPNEEQNENPSVDKTKRIAEIKGMINANNNQIEIYNQKLEEAKKAMEKNAWSDADGEELRSKQTEQENAARMIGILERDLSQYDKQCNTSSEGEEGESNEFCATFLYDEKKAELADWQTKLNESNLAVTALNEKKSAYTQANATINELNTEITRLNNENTQLNKELSSLQ